MTLPNVALYDYFRRAFDFSGRASRSQYWWPRLFVYLVNFVILSVFLSGGGTEWLEVVLEWVESQPQDYSGLANLPPLSSLSKFAATFAVIFGLVTLFPDLSVSFRRFHDMNLPGWLHILFFVAAIVAPFSIIAELIWFIMPGTKGPNKYGADPLSGSN